MIAPAMGISTKKKYVPLRPTSCNRRHVIANDGSRTASDHSCDAAELC